MIGSDRSNAEDDNTLPEDETMLLTPLTTALSWACVPEATVYQVSLRMVGSRATKTEKIAAPQTSFRTPLCPAADYEWSVTSFSKNNSQLTPQRWSIFSTPKPQIQEVTDYAVSFNGVRPGTHWGIMSPLPEDPAAELSPWFDKKTFDSDPPPAFADIRHLLPKPVWDSHAEAIDMYWYTWETLFSTGLFAPSSENSLAVSNVLGQKEWHSFGISTVWDLAFIMQFARYGHAAYPFITTADNCYARQHENGFICREADADNREIYKVYPVSLPLLSWAEWSYYEITGDTNRLRMAFLPLVKEYEWYMLHQRRANGLYWNVGIADGMDDSPRNTLAHYYLSTTCCMVLGSEILSKIADLLGYKDIANWLRRENKELKRLANSSFWDSKHRLYNDLGTNGKPITHTSQTGVCKHAFVFWPLISGVATVERASSLASHLVDPGSFNRPSGIASLSADSSGYSADTVDVSWHGGIWPPIQYMVIKGLQRAGNEGLAAYFAEKYYNSFLRAFVTDGDIKQALAPEANVMSGYSRAVGWGGLAPIALLIEDIFGIRANAPSNEVFWSVRRLERHGLEDLRFGNNRVTLICGARKNQNTPCEITVECDRDFTLVVGLPSGTTRKAIEAGKTSLVISDSQ
ncbi:MAG: trehalase family glycosidase [Armatimonadota bacterium]